MTQKYCPSYWGYSVTEDGRVFTHRRRFGLGQGNGGGVVVDWSYQRELKPSEGHGGYLYVSISTTRGQRSIPLHGLLTDAFIGLRPKGKQVRHLNGNPQDNRLANLVYGTNKDNASDRMRCGKHTIGESHGMAKLTEGDIHWIRKLREAGESYAAISNRYGVSTSAIKDIIKGRRWSHVQ